MRSLPVRKARLSSSVHFVSTARGARTRPSASRTPAQTPPGTGAADGEEKKKKLKPPVKQSCCNVAQTGRTGTSPISEKVYVNQLKPVLKLNWDAQTSLTLNSQIGKPEKPVLPQRSFSWDTEKKERK